MRDSMIFYKSFAEAIECLDEKDQLTAFWNIVNYAFDGTEPDGSGAAVAVFKMAKPQIDKNAKRFENGMKGGRPTNKSKEEKEESEKARHSTEYIKWRDSVFQRDNFQCVNCGSDNDIQAHHINDFDEYPELRYEISNGVTLCRNCHNLIHNGTNQEKTKINQAITKCKPNVNVNDNANANLNDNANANANNKKESGLKPTREKFIPPTIEEVTAYCAERGSSVDAEAFVDFYQSKGWMVGKNHMKDWKSAVRNWERSDSRRQGQTAKPDRYEEVDQWASAISRRS